MAALAQTRCAKHGATTIGVTLPVPGLLASWHCGTARGVRPAVMRLVHSFVTALWVVGRMRRAGLSAQYDSVFHSKDIDDGDEPDSLPPVVDGGEESGEGF